MGTENESGELPAVVEALKATRMGNIVSYNSPLVSILIDTLCEVTSLPGSITHKNENSNAIGKDEYNN